MSVSFQFTIPVDAPFAELQFSDCEQRLQDASLPDTARLSLFRRQAEWLMEQEQQRAALTVLAKAIALKPDDPFTLAYQGLASEQLGLAKQAATLYHQALEILDESHPITAQLWYRHGTTQRIRGKYKVAIASYDRAIALQPEYAEVWSARGVALALIGKIARARAESDRALTLSPDSSLVLNNRGIVLMAGRKYSLALAQFERVIFLQPDFDKAWYNRALALSRLGRDEEALHGLNHVLDLVRQAPTSSSTSALAPVSSEAELSPSTDPTITPSSSPPVQSILTPSSQAFHPHLWHASAWTLHAFLSLKQRQFDTTIHSCRQAQTIRPHLYAPALYKVTALIASGKVWSHALKSEGRQELGRDLWTIGHALKYLLLGLIGLVAILLWGQGSIMASIRQGFPLVLSLAIIALIGVDLWHHKSRLHFVWKTYFGSGILTYLRAVLTLVVTLVVFMISFHYAPAFMRWGWANAVFGSPGNIIFQPLNLLQDLSWHLPHGEDMIAQTMVSATPQPSLPIVLESLWASIGPMPHWSFSGIVSAQIWMSLGIFNAPLFHIGDLHVNVATILIVLFWLALLLGVPFWAHLEERIFRQGANTWPQICTRSVQFGLIHLLAGIPILAGFVLIVPGFLFACRYKYVRDRHYHRHQNPYQADTAGVLASTADHAVYNAILMTLAVAAILREQMVSGLS